MSYVGEEIYNVIPNRYPYMILDTLEVEDNKAVAKIALKQDLWIFDCHYPGHPILPMTLLIESMMQTFLATFLSKAEDKTEIPIISSISGVEGGKISQKEYAAPGDVITIVTTLSSFKRGIAKGLCKAYKNGGENPIIEFEIVEVLPSQMIRIR